MLGKSRTKRVPSSGGGHWLSRYDECEACCQALVADVSERDRLSKLGQSTLKIKSTIRSKGLLPFCIIQGTCCLISRVAAESLHDAISALGSDLHEMESNPLNYNMCVLASYVHCMRLCDSFLPLCFSNHL